MYVCMYDKKNRFFQISRVVDIESSSKSLRMDLMDRLGIPAAKNSRRRPLGRSDLGHPVTMTTDIAKVSQTQKFR